MRRSTRRPPVLTYLLLFGVCLTVGLVTGLLRGSEGPERNPTPTLIPATSLSPLPAGSAQHSILIIGVDELGAVEPKLRAVWLATFQPPGRDLFLLGLPTDYRLPIQDSRTLAEIFTWSPQSGPGPEFLTAVQYPAPVPVDAVAALDDAGFGSLIDYVGGIDLNGVRLRGDQAVAVLGLLEDDPGAALSTQERVLQAMAVRAAGLGTTPELSPLIGMIPADAFLSVPVSQVLTLAAPVLPLDSAHIHVDLLVSP